MSEKYYPSDLVFDMIDILPLDRLARWSSLAAEKEWVWFVDERINYENFDWSWLPDAWDADRAHWFEMKNARLHSYTVLINCRTYDPSSEPKYHPCDLGFKTRWIAEDSVDKAGEDEWIWVAPDLHKLDISSLDNTWLPHGWDRHRPHHFSFKGTAQHTAVKLINPAVTDLSIEPKHHVSDITICKRYENLSSLDVFIADREDEWIWFTDDSIDYTGFDWTWMPEAWDADKANHFDLKGTEQLTGAVLLNPKLYTGEDKHHASNLRLSTHKKLPFFSFDKLDKKDEWIWLIDDNIDYTDFDFDWLPDAWDADRIHYFTMRSTTHQTYTARVNIALWNGDRDHAKFHESDLTWRIQIKRLPIESLEFLDTMDSKDEWIWFVDSRIDYSQFDWNWLPEPWQESAVHYWDMASTEKLSYTALVNPRLYSKGEKQQIHHKSDLRYGIALRRLPFSRLQDLDDLRHRDEWIWFVDDEIDYTGFRFDWLPDAYVADHLHLFKMAGSDKLSYTALVNPKLWQDPTLHQYHDTDLKMKPTTQITWPEGTGTLGDKLDRMHLADNRFTWIIDPRIDYSDFDFFWLPSDWNNDFIHAFCMRGSEQLSYTWFVPRGASSNTNVIYHSCELSFVDGVMPVAHWRDFASAPLSGKDWQDRMWNYAKTVTYGDEWIWIVDPRIDYSDFDFSWLPAGWDTGFVHCFAMRGCEQLSYTWLVNRTSFQGEPQFKYHTSDLKFEHSHETCLLDFGMGTVSLFDHKVRFVNDMEATLRSAIKRAKTEWLWVIGDCVEHDDLDLTWLPDLDKIGYVHCWPSCTQKKGETFLIHIPSALDREEFRFDFDHPPLRRRDWPEQNYSVDSLAQAINIHGTKALYTQFTHVSSTDIAQPYPCLWENRPVIAMNPSGSCSLVPRDCVVKKEIYEYPHLERQETLATDPRMDVVFISNGEPQAGYHSIQLDQVLNRQEGAYYSAKHVMDCKGRLNSYQAAARLSSTDWFIAVFAKCYVTEELAELHKKWTPDYWQEPKHYIFYNHNTDNGLVYGHMAPIAYNRNLIFDNPGGLDITLAQPHTTVPIVLSETKLAGDNWTDWRTAFRETVKLLHYNRTSPTVESEYRLWAWLNKGTPVAMAGAHQGKEFYERCGGEESWLLMTVEWDWLRDYYDSLQCR
jgi:hypothetical protein